MTGAASPDRGRPIAEVASSTLVKHYFEALNAHDLDAAFEHWAPGAVDRLVGQQELTAPESVRKYFGALLAGSPDFTVETLELTSAGGRVTARWRARGTFAGPGRFRGLEPTGARIEIEGCDVFAICDGLIQSSNTYLDTGRVLRQLGLLPASGSRAEARRAAVTNARTRIMARVQAAPPERIADGVWIVRGGLPIKAMNVYLIEDGGGVTVFDGGIKTMTDAVALAAARLGGAKRLVLGHADADHRGIAARLGAPVYCHPAERAAAESDANLRDYWDTSKLAPAARVFYRQVARVWDGGAAEIAGTVSEGDEVAGFRVIELPGHAPGQIGLFRESDRLALVSDCFYTIDPQTGVKGGPRLPHPAVNLDDNQARASIRKLASLEPSAAWPGHAEPVLGDVRVALSAAAAAA